MASDGTPAVTSLYPDALAKAPPPVSGVRVIENAHVAMRDGVRLAVDIYLRAARANRVFFTANDKDGVGFLCQITDCLRMALSFVRNR